VWHFPRVDQAANPLEQSDYLAKEPAWEHSIHNNKIAAQIYSQQHYRIRASYHHVLHKGLCVAQAEAAFEHISEGGFYQ
jgi:hypothetical protein